MVEAFTLTSLPSQRTPPECVAACAVCLLALSCPCCPTTCFFLPFLFSCTMIRLLWHGDVLLPASTWLFLRCGGCGGHGSAIIGVEWHLPPSDFHYFLQNAAGFWHTSVFTRPDGTLGGFLTSSGSMLGLGGAVDEATAEALLLIELDRRRGTSVVFQPRRMRRSGTAGLWMGWS